MDELKKRIEELEEENSVLKARLKKYTCSDRNKRYYEKHKEEILDKAKENKDKYKPSKEKMKEYNQRAYQKKKEKSELK